MAKTSFKKGAKPEPEESEALTTAAPAALANEGTHVEGEVDRGDINMPSLKLVQAIGPMSENFEGGVWVFNGELPLTDGIEDKVELKVVCCRIRKQYEENVEWGGEERPHVFNTIGEVKEAGGWTEWRDNKKPPYEPIANILTLVKMPEKMIEAGQDAFPYTFEADKKDKASAPLVGRWALALWKVKGSAYTRVAKPIFTAIEMTELKRKGLHTALWSLRSNREKLGKYTVYTPVFKRAGNVTGPFAAWALEVTK
jgi:hypothetical protein